jgi:hypothetical protein
MATESSIRVLAGKPPIDAASCGIALALPRARLVPGSGLVHQPSSEALALHDADFDLRHVQLARMLGYAVKLYAAQRCAGARAPQHVLEARTQVGVEIVHNQVNLPGRGIGALKLLPHEADELGLGAPLSNLDDPTPAPWLHGHEHLAGARTHVFVINV